jgi:adenosine kinase
LEIEPKQLSALGTVMTDTKERQIWSYYPGPLTQLGDYSLQLTVKTNDLVVLTPSEPVAFKKHLKEAVLQKLRFMFDPAFFIPNLTVEELKQGIKHAEIIIGNEYEVGMMEKRVNPSTGSGRSRLIRNQLIGKQILVKTMGERGVEIFLNKKVSKIPAVKVSRVADPSGAGDAFRGGFLAGYMAGKPVDECVRMGAVAGAYCVERAGTQNHRFTITEFYQRLEESYGKKNI